jgi:uncharacterized repeat protein (TIGR03803 family)
MVNVTKEFGGAPIVTRELLQILRGLACAIAFLFAAQAQSVQEVVIHRFLPFPQGANPVSAVIRDAAGNFYGTTVNGGAYDQGVVYMVSPTGQQTVLHNFTGGTDGANPYAPLARDQSGNVYGTTFAGGLAGYGVVYEIDHTGVFKVLHSFMGGVDGQNPYFGRLILDSAGNLYGTTCYGGESGAGIVFELSPTGAETILYSFTGGTDGSNPLAGVVRDGAGNLYGTTYYGGHPSVEIYYTYGTIFKLDAAGTESVLWNFSQCGGCAESAYNPSSDLIYINGNLYGTTSGGSLLWSFDVTGTAGFSRMLPGVGELQLAGGLALDAQGNLYATFSGSFNEFPPIVTAGGVYKLSRDGTAAAVYTFSGGADGGSPHESVTVDAEGNIYGTASAGGSANVGVLYKITPAGQESVLYNFPQTDGSNPYGGLIADGQGNLYGTTSNGGANGQGSVFEINSTGLETVLYAFQGGQTAQIPTPA